MAKRVNSNKPVARPALPQRPMIRPGMGRQAMNPNIMRGARPMMPNPMAGRMPPMNPQMRGGMGGQSGLENLQDKEITISIKPTRR